MACPHSEEQQWTPWFVELWRVWTKGKNGRHLEMLFSPSVGFCAFLHRVFLNQWCSTTFVLLHPAWSMAPVRTLLSEQRFSSLWALCAAQRPLLSPKEGAFAFLALCTAYSQERLKRTIATMKLSHLKQKAPPPSHCDIFKCYNPKVLHGLKC